LLTIDELRAEVERGGIDTVVTAFTDMQGRLLGKREHAEFFLEQSAEHGIEGCNYLMAVDMEMDPQPGYAMASWEQGYGDFALTPDLATLRKVPWLEGTALVLCDVGLGERGTMARGALGDEVVEHYLNYGRVEQRLFDQVVTGWERERLYERG
jgi:glutamine synthetase